MGKQLFLLFKNKLNWQNKFLIKKDFNMINLWNICNKEKNTLILYHNYVDYGYNKQILRLVK